MPSRAAKLVTVMSGVSDTTAPTVTITSSESSPSAASPIPLTITFSEEVTGFVVGDITIAGCTLSGFATADNIVFTVNATPSQASVTVDIAEGVCQDAAGNNNAAATQFAITSTVGYQNKVAAIASANLIGYWPMGEASGTTADDKSSQANDGAYSNVTLAQTGIGDGQTAPLFVPASNSYLNVYSAALASDWNGQEGTLSLWIKPSAASVWADGVQRYIAFFSAGTDDNRVGFRKDTAANSLTWLFVAGGTAKSITLNTANFTVWTHFVVIWSKANNYFKVYKSAAQVGTTQTGVGTWAGTLNSTKALFGALVTTPTNVWDGYTAHGALWTTPLSLAQIASLNSLTDVEYIETAAPNTVEVASQDFWNDFSDATKLYTDAGTTTNVASNNDPIRVAIDKFADAEDLTAPSDAVRPLWKTNIQNSLAAGYWNGTDSEMNHTAWADEDFTAFWVVKNLDSAKGSHIEVTGTGGEYVVVTGDTYIPPERAVLHESGLSIASNIVNSMGWNIIELTRSGNTYTLYVNGTNALSNTIASAFDPISIGPNNVGDATWHFEGYMAERMRWNTVLDSETRARVRYWLANKWDIANITYSPYAPV